MTEPTPALSVASTPRPITHVMTIPLGLVHPSDSEARFILNRALTGIFAAAVNADLAPAFIGTAHVNATPDAPLVETFTLTRTSTQETQLFTSALDGLERSLGELRFRGDPGERVFPLFSVRTDLAGQLRTGQRVARAGLWVLRREAGGRA